VSRLWAYVFLFQSMAQDFALWIFKFRFSRVHARKAANYSSRVSGLFSVSVFKPQTRHVVAAAITDCTAHAWRARRSRWFVNSRATCILDHVGYAHHILTTLISHCDDILQGWSACLARRAKCNVSLSWLLVFSLAFIPHAIVMKTVKTSPLTTIMFARRTIILL